MTSGETIVFEGVTKNFGAVRAVSDLSFTVQPGRVTGFLGPNGAGKSTSLRVLLGLVTATAGRATIGGVRYATLPDPMRRVGAALEAAFHPGRNARAHLTAAAIAGGLPRARVGTVLELVGMDAYADRRVGGYSMGMRQRLALATALLGDPGVLVLDEPINGLDPEGIRWTRGFLRALAAEGRTVLLSSHLLSEVQQTVDDVVVLADGRLRYDGPLTGLGAGQATVVDAPDRAALAAALTVAGLTPRAVPEGLSVDADPAEVGRIALAAGVALRELRGGGGLEEEFLALVGHDAATGEGAAR
ncbi:MAG TPA: ATP-binding cassette domain-containing protein [Pseudolysinimonas sp.]|jgi:ABC-2 type transport system ATP-binding protein|nr:ATP-binding cassette domain-containing protein [Pseudolysinimonas sp.]